MAVIDSIDEFAGQLVRLQAIAVASLGAIRTMLIVFILSICMVIDRDQIMAFLFRLVPPAYAEEARLLQTSIARSFGGFLRGRRSLGLVYFGIALLTHTLLGLELTALSATLAGSSMPILFFGPFVVAAAGPRGPLHQARRPASRHS